MDLNFSWKTTDPDANTGIAAYMSGYALAYQNLLTINYQSGTIEPFLATSWSYNASHTQLVLNLRKGVHFQDGTPFDAAAVVYNLERVAAPSSNSACVPFFNTVSSIAADGPSKVVISFASPYSALPDILSAEPCTFMVSPTAIQTLGSAFAEHPVGTSPFKFQSVEVGNYISFTRWPGSWEKAYVNSVTVSTIGDDTSAIDAVQADTAQVFAGQYDLQDIAQVRANHNTRLVETPASNVIFLRFVANKPPFNTLTARRAVAQALNTALVARQVYANHAISTQTLLTPLSWGFDGYRTRGYPQYNPTQAAADVAALPGGKLSFILNIQNTPAWTELAEALQSELQAVPGITVTINPLSTTEYLTDEHASDYQASLANDPVLPDPDFNYYRNFFSLSNENQDGYSDPAFDRLAIEARQTFSVPQRRRLYEQAEAVLAKDMPIAPLLATPVIYVVNKHVHDFPEIDMSASDLSKVWLS